MKLKNKKTGEIVDLSEGFIKDTYCGEKIMIKPIAISNKEGYVYSSLAELNKEWEDCEEPKGYWYYDTTCCRVEKLNHNEDKEIDSSIGNCFETKEEAEKAVEKLKALKRLKAQGFRFDGWVNNSEKCLGDFMIYAHIKELGDIVDDLDLLFGGEELIKYHL